VEHFVVWDEPIPAEAFDGSPITVNRQVRVNVKDVPAIMRHLSQSIHDCPYTMTDEQAIEEFQLIHWGWIETTNRC
jgi:hypothetical protein